MKRKAEKISDKERLEWIFDQTGIDLTWYRAMDILLRDPDQTMRQAIDAAIRASRRRAK